MEVNEMLDDAFRAVGIAKENAATAREAIRQRDILLQALKDMGEVLKRAQQDLAR